MAQTALLDPALIAAPAITLESLVESWSAQERRVSSIHRMQLLEARLRRDPRYRDHRRWAA